jgi:CPA1 family monovalent cation:H+ antiporter
MRGVVSLAAALSLPLTLAMREALVVVTSTVIVLTLVGQGLTLPSLIRALGLGGDTGVREEEARARGRLLEAANARLDELYPVWPGHHPLLDQLRETYRHRSEHVERQRDPSGDGEDRELIEHREIQRTVIDAEREALLRLRAEGETDDEVLRELERELDLEERRMDA